MSTLVTAGGKAVLTRQLIRELQQKIKEVEEAVAFVDDFDMRKLALAKTNLEQGMMWLHSSVKDR